MAMVLAKQGSLEKLKSDESNMRPTCEESMSLCRAQCDVIPYSFHDAH